MGKRNDRRIGLNIHENLNEHNIIGGRQFLPEGRYQGHKGNEQDWDRGDSIMQVIILEKYAQIDDTEQH